MEMDDFELDIDPHSVCRLCLSQTNQLSNLYASTIVDGYVMRYPVMVKYCLGIEVSTSDGLPDKICYICKQEVTKFYAFKQKSKRTDEVLEKAFRKLKNNDELIEPERVLSPEIRPESSERSVKLLNQSEKCVTKSKTSIKQEAIVEWEEEDNNLQILDETEGMNDNEEQLDELELNIVKEEPCFIEPEVEGEKSDVGEVLAEILVTKDGSPYTVSPYKKRKQFGNKKNSQKSHRTCEICMKKFVNEVTFKLHMQNKHPQKSVKSKGFKTEILHENEEHLDEKMEDDKNELDNLRIDTDSNDTDGDLESKFLNSDYYECDICSELFIDKKIYIEHCQNHDEHHVRESNDTAAESDEEEMKGKCSTEFCIEPVDPVDQQHTILDNPNEFTCFLCNKDLRCRSVYDQHMKLHDSMRIIAACQPFFKCLDCRQVFLTDITLDAHRAEIHQKPKLGDPSESCTDYQYLEDDDDGEFVCGICGLVYPNIEAVQHHIMLHSEKFMCPFEDCGCQYDMFSRLSIHITNKHINTELFKCKHCEYNAESFDDLQFHLKNNCTERRFLCGSHCDKKFFSKKALQHHLKIIKGKRFTCQYCGKTFSQQGELTIHNRTHTGERPFECTICGKAYKTSSMRAAHMDAHIPGKTFPCTLCDKKLQTRTSYRNHMKRHTEEKKHSCKFCGKKFFTKYHVKLHSSKIHEREWNVASSEYVDNVEILS